jgi:VIT1/CCC1 family predicted Fe2+/Mn2+ transporter
MADLLALASLAPATLLSSVLMLAIVGFLVWLVLQYVPMPAMFKQVIAVFAVVVLVIYVARLLGLF